MSGQASLGACPFFMRFFWFSFCLLLLSLSFVHAQEKNIFADFQDVNDGGMDIPEFFPINIYGANGLLRTFSSMTPKGNMRQVKVGLMGSFYTLKKNFPTLGDQASQFSARLHLQYSPSDFLTLSLSSGMQQTNDGGSAALASLNQWPVIDFGTQWTFVREDRFALGALYKAQYKSAVDNIVGSEAAINHDLLATGTFALDQDDQFWVHINMGFRIDNHVRVGGSSPSPRSIHLLDIYPINPYLAALGLEYRWSWGLTGIEYSLDFMPGLLFQAQPQRGSWTFKAYVDKKKKLGVQLGFDFGFSQADFSRPDAFQEATYKAYVGTHYLLGSGKKKEKNKFDEDINVFEKAASSKNKKRKRKKKSKSKSPKGTLKGLVTNIETGEPIAKVRVQTCEGAIVQTDKKGMFEAQDLPGGPCQLVLSHSQYDVLEDTVDITVGERMSYDFGLLAGEGPPVRSPVVDNGGSSPKVAEQVQPKSSVTLQAKNRQGNPIAATIIFVKSGKKVEVPLDASGRKSMTLMPGQYEVFASFQGAESSTQYVMIEAGDQKHIQFSLGQGSKQGPSSQSALVSDEGTFLRLNQKIEFHTGKSSLVKQTHGVLDPLVAYLQKHAGIALIEIAGHTDDQGSANTNLKLSQARANSVKSYLVKQGIAASRLKATGYGEDFPIATNATSQGRNTNRRVVFKVLKRN